MGSKNVILDRQLAFIKAEERIKALKKEQYENEHYVPELSDEEFKKEWNKMRKLFYH